MSRKHVVFDTTVMSALLNVDDKYRASALAFLESRRSSMTTFAFTTVTLQELATWHQLYMPKRWVGVTAWLRERFGILPFDSQAALLAGKLQAATYRSSAGKPTELRREMKNRWFRDAAIAATAERFHVDEVVSADADFERFKGKVRPEVSVIQAR